ncbi:hypothetical protein GCM10010406_50050 [Streptomyces thermolineatus]|uniref:DUF2202 domain-containing protein n=1 Tax=Streptomyces thermolineatus TaxID=44033 RepID=A0ABN3MVP5_9ACTN
MKRSVKLTAALAASGVLLAGGALAGGVALASDGDGDGARHGTQSRSAAHGNGGGAGTADCEDGRGGSRGDHGGKGGQGGQGGQGGHGGQGSGQGGGQGSGQGGGQGSGRGDHASRAGYGGGKAGAGAGGLTAESGTLTAGQRAGLAAMAEEEKLAHDLYTAFAERYDARIFGNIAESESRHLEAVRTLMDRYGIDDPTEGRAAGDFAGAETRATYDRLLARGEEGKEQALEAGRTVERTDIADLTAALEKLDAPDVAQVYGNLLEASRNHLAAFERQLAV